MRVATVEVELEKKPKFELRSFELDQALKKPKTTVVELRAFERCTLLWYQKCYLCIVIISANETK